MPGSSLRSCRFPLDSLPHWCSYFIAITTATGIKSSASHLHSKLRHPRLVVFPLRKQKQHMADYDDCWGLSADQLDQLEQDAYRQLAECKASCPSTPPMPASSPLRNERPACRTSLESRFDKVESLSSPALSQPNKLKNTVNYCQGSSPKLSVHLFLHSGGVIAAKFPYHQKLVDAFNKIPKASWNWKERIWMFPPSSLSKAEDVLNAVHGLSVQVQKLDPLVQRAFAASLAVKDLRDLYDRIPTDIESKLMPFQRESVRFALQHGGRVLIADETGLGKTIQAIAIASCLHDAWPVLVISPSSLQIYWASMIQQWLNIPTEDIWVVLPQTRGSNKAGFRFVYSNTKGDLHLDGMFNVISYDIVPIIQSTLLDMDFQIVIADESHFMKNAQTKRTVASLHILQKAQYVVLLNGSPALSRPIELFTQLQALYPSVYKDVNEFGNRYCRGGFYGLYQGASNLEELHNLMKATIMIRRLKKDVLSDLPVKRRQQVFLHLSEKQMCHIRGLFQELETEKIKIQSCDSKELIYSLKFTQTNLMKKIYNDSAEAKIPAVLDYLDTVIEVDCKFLVFAHHQAMIGSIHQHLLKKKVKCITIDGQTPVTIRQTLATNFQNQDDIKAAVLSIEAGGVGLILTAATTVIFAELSWTPDDIIQAEDCAQRIGQVSSVNIYYLLANGTVDDIIWGIIQGKLENLGQMLGGETFHVYQSGTRASPSKAPFCYQMLHGQKKKLDVDTRASPLKQKTLDSYLKRCSTTTKVQPKMKNPRC